MIHKTIDTPQIDVKNIIDDSHQVAHLMAGEVLSINVGQASDKGVKTNNEDAVGIKIPTGTALNTKGIVSVISDGVSTAEQGARASEISVSNFIADYYSTPETWSVQTASTKVMTALNRWLYGLGQDYRDAHKGYICTFSAVIIKSCTAHILHVGDTRICLYRNGALSQLTRDHATQIERHKTYLSRALGLDVKLDVDYRQCALEQGDLLLLTTDGVHDVIDAAQLILDLSSVVQNQTIDDALCDEFCHQLISKAIESGSGDNVSAQLIHIGQLPNPQIEDVYRQLSSLPFPPPMDIGMKLDGLTVTRIIHQSQRSHVYQVTDETGQQYCMKTPSVNYIDDAAYIERFMLESWIAKRIDNQHVIKLIQRQRQPSALYYLTAFVDGISLSQWIDDNDASIEQKIEVIKQLEKGLRALHRKETMHHDLKPDNVLMHNLHVTIIDFGSCYIKAIAEIDSPLVRDNILGTLDYSAPELILGFNPDMRADQFSLAVIAYELLTGQLPFSGRLGQCKTRHDYLALQYQAAYKQNPMVPEWMDVPLSKAMAFDPNARFVDTHEFIHALTTPPKTQVIKPSSPLIQRNPVRFWQTISALLLLTLLCSLII
ncbi:protein kinase [Shewanella maritima]|uniref:protein kinase domain-containing protein n=1 Tax=Shewanella maritima TaxID=2520507 RepID=UPI0037361621